MKKSYTLSTLRYNTVLKGAFPYLLMAGVVLLGYWQISFFQYALKYDMIDCYYPWRFMVSESLRNGMLPFWNPYQTLGYPLHADPQSGAWYPIAWIIGYIREFDIYSLHVEYVIHLLIAAFGMYFLGNTLKFNNKVSFVIAIAYVFSGFFIGNSQHFTYTISGAWIPLIIAQYILLYEKANFKHALYFAFFMFMLVAGGYPAFLFILAYFILFLFLFYAIKLIHNKKFRELKLFVFNNLIAFIATALLSTVILISVFYLTPYITRGGKIPLDMAFLCPLSPKSLISFVIPFASIRNMVFYDTDLSMSNAYFGIIPLLFFTYSLFKRKPAIYTLFIVFALICLAASMGKYLPVREFLYDYIPFMGMFRFPSLFRLFPILFFLLIAGYGMNHMIMSGNIRNKKLIVISIVLFAGFCIALILSRIDGYLTIKDFIKHELFKASQISEIRQHIAFQSVVQMFFLGLVVASFFIFKNMKKVFISLVFIATADMIFSAQLNAPYTVYSEFYKVKDVKKISNTFPKDFPVPDSKNILTHNDTSGIGNGTFWKNLNTFHKQIAWDGFAPIVFKGYAFMADSIPLVFRGVLSNPPVYLASDVIPEDSALFHQQNKKAKPSNCYLDKSDFEKMDTDKYVSVNGDTAFIFSFFPEKIQIVTRTVNPRLLCLQQNYYPGWTVTVNNTEAGIIKSNFGLMSVSIPKGESTVVFEYDFSPVRIGLYISAFSLATVIIFFAMVFILRNNL